MPLTQRRHHDRNHIDPVIKVLAKPALVHEVFEVVVSGGNQPEVDLFRRPASQSLHRTLLQHPQQLALQPVIQGADFVQKESAAMRALDHPRLGGLGSCECSLLVAEQLRLHERFGQGGAVQTDIRFFSSRPSFHDGAGDQLFSGAALAANHHARIAVGNRGDGLIHLTHGFASAN